MAEQKRILLVEDNVDHAALTISNIQATGRYQVDLATTGKEALELFDHSDYDLALIDYALPDINGLNLLSKILEASEGFPVVLITGLGSEVVAVEAMRRGAYDYVVKSGDYYKVLPRVIDKTLEKYELVILNRELKRKLDEKAIPDPLTGVWNEDHFGGIYIQQLEIAKRNGRKLALLRAAVDDFEVINDRYGHPLGDAILIHVASILRQCKRSFDFVARFGEDGFVVLMLEAGQKEAEAMVLDVETAIKRLNTVKTLPIEITLSIGISVSNVNYGNLLEEAGQQMHRMKIGSHADNQRVINHGASKQGG